MWFSKKMAPVPPDAPACLLPISSSSSCLSSAWSS